MPHAILRFRLPSEQSEFASALQGAQAKSVLWDIDQYCRGVLKHGEPTQEVRLHLEHIRRLIRESPGLME